MKSKQTNEELPAKDPRTFLKGLVWGMGISLTSGVVAYLVAWVLLMNQASERFSGSQSALNVIGPLYILIVVGFPFPLIKRDPFDSIRGLAGYWIGAALMWVPVLMLIRLFFPQ